MMASASMSTGRARLSSPLHVRHQDTDAQSDFFFDACSEPSRQSSLASSRQNSFSSVALSPTMGNALSQEAVTSRLLAELLAIEHLCVSSSAGGGPAGEVRVECLLEQPSDRFWVCAAAGCPEVTACLWTQLRGVTQDEIVFAVTDPEERMRWDRDSFRSYDLLRVASPEDPHDGDVIYCVCPAPRPLSDRDMLQMRWTRASPKGWTMICQSIVDDGLMPEQKGCVRAFTHISGYLLRPVGDVLDLTVISRTDLGGNIPSWAQNMVRRMAKHKPVEWARKLGAHCANLRARGGPPPRGK